MLKHLGISLKDAILSRSDRTVASGRDVTDEIDTLLRALVIVIAVVTVSLLAASAIGSLTH